MTSKAKKELQSNILKKEHIDCTVCDKRNKLRIELRIKTIINYQPLKLSVIFLPNLKRKKQIRRDMFEFIGIKEKNGIFIFTRSIMTLIQTILILKLKLEET